MSPNESPGSCEQRGVDSILKQIESRSRYAKF